MSAVEAVRAADPVLVLAATSGTLHPLTLPGLHNLHNLLHRHVSNGTLNRVDCLHQGITICGRRPENFEWKQFYINKDDLKQEAEKRMS